ncbi:unnamed protein product, partial [Meganyctiphanes norvegica]
GVPLESNCPEGEELCTSRTTSVDITTTLKNSLSDSDILEQPFNSIEITSGSINVDDDNHETKAIPDELFKDTYIPPTTQEEKEKIEKFDPSKLNYTALMIEIDNWIANSTDRNARFYSHSVLPKFLTNIGKYLDFEQVAKEIETSIMSTMSCNACKAGVGLLQHYVETGKNKEEMLRAASKLCTSFKVETPRVCMGIINLMA